MNNQYGGYVKSSFVSQIIIDISRRNNQTPENKRGINMSITNTGHGCILLGSSSRLEGGSRNIRMLVGAHFARNRTLKIGTFGGKCNMDELTIDTMIRETIEEIFNFETSQVMINSIREYLNINTDYYYIFKLGDSNAYSYIFDISILGDFIRIIDIINRPLNIALYIPANDGFSNINSYLDSNVKYSDTSSFNGINNESIEGATGTTIKLVEFMRNRYLSKRIFETYRQLGIRMAHGLNEIKYLSFASLSKLIASAPSGRYDLFNFTKNRLENLKINRLLIKLLGKDIIRFISTYQ
jgi:hypothetical protein